MIKVHKIFTHNTPTNARAHSHTICVLLFCHSFIFIYNFSSLLYF